MDRFPIEMFTDGLLFWDYCEQRARSGHMKTAFMFTLLVISAAGSFIATASNFDPDNGNSYLTSGTFAHSDGTTFNVRPDGTETIRMAHGITLEIDDVGKTTRTRTTIQ